MSTPKTKGAIEAAFHTYINVGSPALPMTLDLRLRIVALMGDLGAIITHLDTIDEVFRNPSTAAQDIDITNAEYSDAHFAADVAVARMIELAETIEQATSKGGM